MKAFFKHLALLTMIFNALFFAASSATADDNKKLNAATENAAGTTAYSCTLDSIPQAKKDLTSTSSKKKLRDLIDNISIYLDSCRATVIPTQISPKNQIDDFYGLINELLSAQVKSEKIRECIKTGISFTEPWNSPFKTIENSDISSAIKNTLASCNAKREKQISNRFIAEPCPFFNANHKYSRAIAVPKNWNLSKDGDACLYLYGGKNRNKPEEEGIHLRENSPHLLLFTTNNHDMIDEIFIDFDQGELSNKNYCLSGLVRGIDLLATSGNEKNKLVRIRTHYEHCLQDGAAFTLDAIYKIDAKKSLLPVDELSIKLH